MSTVDKMLIKGIRSFSPENKNVITFFRPLTLIVGHNGAGKTTIIECLKLSCTGELPPNARSGQSFIHDPKVSGETETKAQIKLRFKTAAGKDVVCIRSFQLTQKASKMEYKAIESVLQTINPHTGEKVCLSYRCADMDREVPALMGVSKAILENVIFVHQDEANWPLQDPSTLKKKFDDIFSATRYTKALEVIKKLHKEQAQEIKTYKLKLENLQTLKDAAYKLRQSIAHDQEIAASLKTQMQKLEEDLQEVETKIERCEITLKDLRKLQDQIKTKSTERSTLFREQQKKYADLEDESEDTDAELLEWKTKFDERIAALESRIGKLNREKGDIETNIPIETDTISDCISEISNLQAEAKGHLSLKGERDVMIKNLFSVHNLGPIPDAPFSNEVALSLTNRLNARFKDLETDLEDKKKSNETEINSIFTSYVDANDRLNKLQAELDSKAQSKARFLRQIEEKVKARDTLESEISFSDISHLDEKETSMEVEVQRMIKQLDERDFSSSIVEKKSEVLKLDEQIKTLSKERDDLAADSEDRVKLSLKKTDLENHKKKYKRIMDEYKEKIRSVLKGRFPADKGLKADFSHALSAIRREYDDLNSKCREAEKEVNLVQMKIHEVTSNMSKLHKEMDSKKRFIELKLQSLDQQLYGVDSYIEVLRKAKEKLDDLQSKYNMAEGMRRMFEPFEQIARNHHFCPCCERPFSADEEDDFVRKQRTSAASSTDRMKTLAVESSSAESFFQQLDKLRIIYEEYLRIGKETLPSAERNVDELNEELEQKSQALDDILGVLAQVKADKDIAEALVQPVDTADRIFQEMQNLQKQVDELKYKLDSPGQSVRSMEEIQSELKCLMGTKENMENDIQKLMSDQRNMEKDISNLQRRWYAAREEKINAHTKFDQLNKVEKELELLIEEKTQLELEEKHQAEALVPLSREKEKHFEDHKNLKARLDLELKQRDIIVRNYQRDLDELLRVNSKILKYNELRMADCLKELQQKKSLSESKVQGYQSRLGEILAELNEIKSLQAQQDKLRRNIADNISYRKTKADVDQLTCEIECLEEQMLKTGLLSVFEADLHKLLRERESIISEISRHRGTLSVHESNISKHKIDLKQAQYKDVDKRHTDQLIQLKTTEMANKDLDRYYNALDKALMRFHTMKMEEINKIIRELWQQTYRGQDIDYIYIHSNSEGAGTRSYSYRVLMQTGDTELEMRGRCSAGQKVLASLIIRLALAETFCLNCGILALDEPTTNLDGPNAESLACALLRIIEDRKSQENFQLIVITHDERFAHLIGQRQHAEKYYRVTKDDHQHSIIEAQEIFD